MSTQLQIRHLLYPLIKYRDKEITVEQLKSLFTQTALMDILISLDKNNDNTGVYFEGSILNNTTLAKAIDWKVRGNNLYLITNTVKNESLFHYPDEYLSYSLSTDYFMVCYIDELGLLHFNRQLLDAPIIQPSTYFRLYEKALNHYEPLYYFWEPDDIDESMDKMAKQLEKEEDNERANKYKIYRESIDEGYKDKITKNLGDKVFYNGRLPNNITTDIPYSPTNYAIDGIGIETPYDREKVIKKGDTYTDCSVRNCPSTFAEASKGIEYENGNKEHTAKPTMKSVGESMDAASSLKDLPEDVRKSVIEAFNKSITNIIYSCTHKLDELNNMYNESDIAGEGVVEDNNIDNEPDESDDIDIERTEDKPDKGLFGGI